MRAEGVAGQDSVVAKTEVLEVRRATEADVPAILSLVNHHARRGQLLPRSAKSVYETIGDWLVACTGDELVGCVSLLRYTSGLVEVRSLAVSEGAQGHGVGTRLMEALLREARSRRIPTLFALTRVVDFFRKFDFVVTDKAFFPEKVWHDCQQCPLRDNCDETAVVLHLN
ncbi:MAG TPA: GNAT family N-acetyltransferase [Candidatus Sulfomarinibacteraceae bacterium]|nr:GNAT family N-acetyltransferase [Candidatus Sulfomarinibacteraceae bacterium]